MKKDLRRWDIVHRFEDKHRAVFLRRLSVKRSAEIFAELYEFSQKFVDRKFYTTIDRAKIDAICRQKALFAKVVD